MAERVCSVCENDPPEAGSLNCGHQFCHDCFSRYEQGSLEELDHCIRCCICGNRTLLTVETRGEQTVRRFGRDCFPKLREPVGIAQLSNGDYVTADPTDKRIYVLDSKGNHKTDYAYVHNTVPQSGIAVTKQDYIAIPFTDGAYVYVSFYTPGGAFLSSTYLKLGCVVRSLTCSPRNEILVTDSANGCVYVINTMRVLSKSFQLERQVGEVNDPVPWGVAVNSRGEVMVSDAANHTVRVYDDNFALISTLGGQGSRPGQFRRPRGLAMDEHDRLLVADTGNHRVQLFTEDFLFRRYIVRYNSGTCVYVAPSDVTYVPGGHVAVLLTGTGDALAAEVRFYTTAGPQM